MSWQGLKDKIEKFGWPPPLPEIRIDRETFEWLAADPELTKGEGDCAGHTPVRFWDKPDTLPPSPKEGQRVSEWKKGLCTCGAIDPESYDDHSITCSHYWKLTPDEERDRKDRGIAEEVCAEQRRQVEKWGEQNHPNLAGTGLTHPEVVAPVLGIPTADQARARCEQDFSLNQGNWAAILVEEVAEAIQEAALSDDEKLREELIQVAAVACSWAAAIDRRHKS